MIIGNKYKLIKSIGEGAFGKIFSAENVRTREMVAIKSEPISTESKMLKYETKVYQYLGNRIGFPQVKWFGVENGRYFMAITLLGESLTSYKNNSNTQLSLANIFLICQKMVERLEYIHCKGLIHRDIKPDNFLFKGEELYLIDFGLCKKYKRADGEHIEERSNRTPLGTANFISVNVHCGIEPSRRDDIESVGYIILFMLLKDDLPWSKYNSSNHSEMSKEKIGILEQKIPAFLKEYLIYCRTLKFDDTPDYSYLKKLFSNNENEG
uniref:non-specific serine/threonine protein kinase n=1 Tax=viral metagenome TaxID=1070528 RepID=A0A6C0KZ98_9ZZZZ